MGKYSVQVETEAVREIETIDDKRDRQRVVQPIAKLAADGKRFGGGAR